MAFLEFFGGWLGTWCALAGALRAVLDWFHLFLFFLFWFYFSVLVYHNECSKRLSLR